MDIVARESYWFLFWQKHRFPLNTSSALWTLVTPHHGFSAIQSWDTMKWLWQRKGFLVSSSLRADRKVESYLSFRDRITLCSEKKRKIVDIMKQKPVKLSLYWKFVGNCSLQYAWPKYLGNRKVRCYLFWTRQRHWYRTKLCRRLNGVLG